MNIRRVNDAVNAPFVEKRGSVRIRKGRCGERRKGGFIDKANDMEDSRAISLFTLASCQNN